MQIDWSKFVGRPPVNVDERLAGLAVRDRHVLITGAGGSIGAGLASAAVLGQPRTLLLLDISEGALHQTYRSLLASPTPTSVQVVPITGSVLDRHLLTHILRRHPVDLILHTAAYKHVPLMERNPFAALANNSIGTYRLVSAALEAGVPNLTLLSTDKAVNPQSIMGVSKRIAELVVLSHATASHRLNAVRLGNVLGSSGSVAPIFQEQVTQGRALTVTHPQASRYFLTQSEAEVAILSAATSPQSGKLYIADCGASIPIVELARYIAQGQAPIEIIGLRPGDKLHEELIAENERIAAGLFRGMRVIESPLPGAAGIEPALQRLESALNSFSYSDLLAIVQELVPGYKPADTASSDLDLVEAR
jgi:FlaA1/EpsC-like NDP-sugar epimerase